MTIISAMFLVGASACQGDITETTEEPTEAVGVTQQAALKHPIRPDQELFVTNLQTVTDLKFTRYAN